MLRGVRCSAGRIFACSLAAVAGWLGNDRLSAETPRSAGEAASTPAAHASSATVAAGAVDPLVLADWIDADRRFAGAAAPARGPKSAAAVSTARDAAGAVDGVKNGRFGFHTASAEKDPWWQVDLGRRMTLDRVVVFNRTDGNTAARTKDVRLLVSDAPAGPFREVYRHNGQTFYGATDGHPLVVTLRERNIAARVVRAAVPGRVSFALDEVEVYAADAPKKNVALNQPADQKSVGQHSRAKDGSSQTAAHTADGGYSSAHIQAVLQRGHKLAQRLRSALDREKLSPHIARLAAIQQRLSALETAAAASRKPAAAPAASKNAKPDPNHEARRALYFDARAAVRAMALTNPRLAIDKILFLKRHDPGGVYHMCDQYYGFNAVPGGGLFVLHHPFGPNPRLENLLANAVVEKGRLAGRKLDTGALVSPNIAYDGRSIVFAYTEGRGNDLEWTPEASYHVFRVQADGSGLVQLTDGPANDFDPCFLPGGRIVFVSERRGGYLRCGRHCPVYTLFSMEPDGSDALCLSYHETHEWHPSVNNEGMIVFTRWDYVDRDTNIAHHIWTCFPDGRDPRSFHGNYPVRREGRPWMEMSIRAIPGSPRYVATAASHHGHALGSLVLISPRPEDDGVLSQLERLTPEVPFPEAEASGASLVQAQQYATAWPLGEDDFLCVYDAKARNHGIYWIDRDGNKELIYRDPAIACMSPMPLEPRPSPPVIPSQTLQTASDRLAEGGRVRPATVAVMNVYDSDFAWPAGAKVKALRVVQVLPKTTPPPNEPRIGIAQQTNARAVLGTAPVEVDGSAYFEAPAGKELYFQAVDEHGMAIQSMRSGTYLHPGEQMTCQGCHERKHRPPESTSGTPLALRRRPSKLTPDVDGSSPFNYVRLVQPVLDRNCVDCHRQKKALDLSGTLAGPYGWSKSYQNLAQKYGFYYDVFNGAINAGVHGGVRTPAGKFGAKAAKLMDYLGPNHYDVHLTAEERHRLTLWLDCNSEFLGSYENATAQARGQIVPPTLD